MVSVKLSEHIEQTTSSESVSGAWSRLKCLHTEPRVSYGIPQDRQDKLRPEFASSALRMQPLAICKNVIKNKLKIQTTTVRT